MAPVNLMMTVEKGGQVLLTSDAWKDIEFEVAPGFGSVVHVCAPDDCPGYMPQDSLGANPASSSSMLGGLCCEATKHVHPRAQLPRLNIL